ncbi:MAG: phosphoribosylformylglycinamidine synthase [Thermotogota bacterium]
MNKIFRVYVKKKAGFDIQAQHLLTDIRSHLSIPNLEQINLFNRYDIEGIDEKQLVMVINLILSDPVVDLAYTDDLFDSMYRANIKRTSEMKCGVYSFGSEYLPGQYDQRADSTEQCMRILISQSNPTVKTAKIYGLFGKLTDKDKKKIEDYIINPVDSRKSLELKPMSLEIKSEIPHEVEILKDFIQLDEPSLKLFHLQHQLAMSMEDLSLCQHYFQKEKRDPTITEIKVIDTYWSDHCRHTTFSTVLSSVTFENTSEANPIKDAFKDFKEDFEKYYNKNKHLTLMDIATLRMKIEKKENKLKELVVSDEINACTVEIDVNTKKGKIPYNLLFKNETHNHPTEIEPFGGAATCLGGAIRDPLSGRAYVYQSMRVTGSGDPRQPVEDTLEGKLPQRKITTEAAHGFSSYGNQIGIATGMVKEYYHPGFVAKRLECGAVIGAVPSENVKREKPEPGDLVLLIGGDTGRDGCGGATGSSKSHEKQSIEQCGAEVQKGNPPMERKLQRLFRNSEVTKRIKKCNDFGAGGVSVAIGELADGLEINLDAVEKKYAGLDGTELAISESQERMAIVISPDDFEFFKRESASENLKCTNVATITDDARLKMNWQGKTIVNIARDFLDTNGAQQHRDVFVSSPKIPATFLTNHSEEKDSIKKLLAKLTNIKNASQLGLIERFDCTVGASSALFPFGGKNLKTPSDVMAAYLPTENIDTSTISLMAHGYDPRLTEWSPYHGGIYNIVQSCSQLIAAGAKPDKIWLSLQEYFEALREDPARWGNPFAALLGAYKAQKELGYAAIGGKDSMSGSFENINVPPTLISFAVGITEEKTLCTNELKGPNHYLVYLKNTQDQNLIPDFQKLKKHYQLVHSLINENEIISCGTVNRSGILFNLCLRAFGNGIGFHLTETEFADLNETLPGSFLIECEQETKDVLTAHGGIVIGQTCLEKSIKIGKKTVPLQALEERWLKPLDDIFPFIEPIKTGTSFKIKKESTTTAKKKFFTLLRDKKPRVFIPVFPGTNCEYDTQKAFVRAGADCQISVFRNLTPDDIEASSELFANEIAKSQILMIPGGFSAGDEPDGSGKFIAAVFRHAKIQQAITDLLEKKDGLILGICNGFQALLRLGLLPFGKYSQPDENLPTLTYNHIGRHISTIASTKVVSTKSSWFSPDQLDKTFKIPLSHTEGRFFCSNDMLEQLMDNDQIASCYCTPEGIIDPLGTSNPNGSIASIEGITSPDGKVLGKMGHNERVHSQLYKNVPGMEIQDIFKNGVNYFLS